MRLQPHAYFALLIAMIACGGSSPRPSPTPLSSRPYDSSSVVGRWALLTLVINGEDKLTQGGVPSGAVLYTFNANGTFRIEQGDSVRETGAWSVDNTVSPKGFAHVPDVDGKSGPHVPGIYTIHGDTLKISIWAPNPANRRPTQFRSVSADGSWLLIFWRVTR
jgi:uncharacterized protein (TIGR03067 family)